MQDMAKKSIALLMNQLNAAQGPLKVKVAQIVFDLMMVHDTAELFDKALTVSSHAFMCVDHIIDGSHRKSWR